MDVNEGASTKAEKERRVFFWFLCSALGGVCAREMFQSSPEQITVETFKIAEEMTRHFIEHYGDLQTQ